MCRCTKHSPCQLSQLICHWLWAWFVIFTMFSSAYLTLFLWSTSHLITLVCAALSDPAKSIMNSFPTLNSSIVFLTRLFWVTVTYYKIVIVVKKDDNVNFFLQTRIFASKENQFLQYLMTFFFPHSKNILLLFLYTCQLVNVFSIELGHMMV